MWIEAARADILAEMSTCSAIRSRKVDGAVTVTTSAVVGLLAALFVASCGPSLEPQITQETSSMGSTHGSTAASTSSDASTVTSGMTGTVVDGSTSTATTGTGGVDCEVAPAEALPALDAIIAGAIAYFETEHSLPDGDGFPVHHCPFHVDTFEEGTTWATPQLGYDCNVNPMGQCAADTERNMCVLPIVCYPPGQWTANPIWVGLGFALLEPHRFHYEFAYSNSVRGYGECRFTATAFGDLDADATFSTYTRSGTLNARGAVLDDEVEITMPCE